MNFEKPHFNLIVITGPTASGKTAFAANLAHEINSEIISADSRQVYRNMDIGTGKDINEYYVNGSLVPYHLINIVDAGYKYNVYEYQRDFKKVFTQLQSKKILPVLCGGSGMYIEAVTKAFKLLNVPVNEALRTELQDKPDAELINMLRTLTKMHNTTDVTSRKRLIRAIEIARYTGKHTSETFDFPVIKPVYIGLKLDRNTRRRRITERLHQRLQNGLVKEVECLLDNGVSANDLIFYGLEYKFITQYLLNQLSYDTMVQKLNTAIHQFAKRQMTWFRRMEKNGDTIHWIDAQLPAEQVITDALQVLAAKQGEFF